MSPIDLSRPVSAADTSSAAMSAPKMGASPSFSKLLQNQIVAQAPSAGVKFSSHAQTRLASRQIVLSANDIARLGDAITRAAQKGAHESLVVMDKAALVVSVPNRTVITAVDKSALKDNIFTNIDSAMIL